MLRGVGHRLLASLAEIRDALDADPMLGKITTAHLELLLARGPDDDLAKLFGDALQGMAQGARYGGIKVAHRLHHAASVLHRHPTLSIARGQRRTIVGDLYVEGDVANAGILVVTGNVEIGGSYIGPTAAYSLLAVGGVAKVRHVSTSGEVIVGEALDASGVVHVVYNDYSAVLPVVRAHALVIEDNFPVLGEVTVAHRFDRTRSVTGDDLLALFGKREPAADGDDDDGSLVRRTIVGEAAVFAAVQPVDETAGSSSSVAAPHKPKQKSKPKPTRKPKPNPKPTRKRKPKPKR